MKPDRYKIAGGHRLTPELVAFVGRRVECFLNAEGMRRPMLALMTEAYLQGCVDTLDAAQVRAEREAA